MKSTPYIIISLDIGATKCAAAIMQVIGGDISCKQQARINLSECDSFLHLTKQLEAQLQFLFKDAGFICIAASGRYKQGIIIHERGYPFSMNVAETAKKYNWKAFAVIHDYVPVACATYCDTASTYSKTLHRGLVKENARRVALGVGTGLGIKDCIKLPSGEYWFGENEAGHVAIPLAPHHDNAMLEKHQALLSFLNEHSLLEHGEGFSFESLLSGNGLVRLHQFTQNSIEPISAKDVCKEAWAQFSWYLGLYVATLQLMFMPFGGVWIAGGVIQKNLHLFDSDDFANGLQALPAYSKDRNSMPIYVFCDEMIVHYGCAFYAMHCHSTAQLL